MAGVERLPAGMGGALAMRSERGVHRSSGPWTSTEHALLRHLQAAGFVGAPRVVGFDETGREVLTYVEGEVLATGPEWRPGVPTPWPDWAQADECLAATARLLRDLHEASASFVPPIDAVWRRHATAALGRGEIVCHGDIGPHNTVYRDGLPVAFIDWDTIRPNSALVEFGTAAWHYVPLGDDAYFAASDFVERPDLARRLALFSRAYGIAGREDVAWALQQARQRSVEALKYFQISPAEGATALRFVADQLAWLDENLEHVLSDLDDEVGSEGQPSRS